VTVVKLNPVAARRLLLLRVQATGAHVAALAALDIARKLSDQADAARQQEAERIAEEHGRPDAVVEIDPVEGTATIKEGPP
jgi:hypothetical protein